MSSRPLARSVAESRGRADEPEDSVGETLTAAYMQDRTQASLIIDTPGEAVGNIEGAGAAPAGGGDGQLRLRCSSALRIRLSF